RVAAGGARRPRKTRHLVRPEGAGDRSARCRRTDPRRGLGRRSGLHRRGGGPITYDCLYANGWVPNGAASVGSNGSNWMLNDVTGPVDLSSPLKWGCEETAFVPPGLPGLAGGSPATSCASSSESPSSTNDCTAVSGTQRCKPANLVYGDGVDDGRCSLVGLSW